MNTLAKNIAQFILASTALLSGSGAFAAIYEQTLYPEQWCTRPFTCTFTFTDALVPISSGTLTVVGQGDINEPWEFAAVLDEFGTTVDYAWDIWCASIYVECTDSLSIPIDSLLAAWSDGNISFDFVVPSDNGLSGVRFISLSLTYEAATEVPLPGTLGLLVLGLVSLGLSRRR